MWICFVFVLFRLTDFGPPFSSFIHMSRSGDLAWIMKWGGLVIYGPILLSLNRKTKRRILNTFLRQIFFVLMFLSVQAKKFSGLPYWGKGNLLVLSFAKLHGKCFHPAPCSSAADLPPSREVPSKYLRDYPPGGCIQAGGGGK